MTSNRPVISYETAKELASSAAENESERLSGGDHYIILDSRSSEHPWGWFFEPVVEPYWSDGEADPYVGDWNVSVDRFSKVQLIGRTSIEHDDFPILDLSTNPWHWTELHDASNDVSRPRLFCFRLRTLLILVCVLGVLCGLVGNKVRNAERQKASVAWIESMTAIVTYEHESLERDAWYAPRYRTEPRGPKWLRDLIGVDYFSAIRGVSFYECPTTDLSPLADLPSLEKLVVRESPASDLSPVANLTNLRILTICETQVVDLTPVANLAKLEFLYLSGDSVGDVTPLANLTNLETLFLVDTRTSDFSPLAELWNLKELHLWGVQIDDLPVDNLTSLEVLDVKTYIAHIK